MAETYTLEQMREMVEMMNGIVATRKNDPASTTLDAPTLQGPFPGNGAQYGIFAGYGARPQRFTTLVRPPSITGVLPLIRSEYQQEQLEIMTGVTKAAGSNADGWCGNPPTVGQGKVCKQSYTWGDLFVKTQLNALPEIGALRTRSEVPGEILNSGPGANPLIPDLMYALRDTRSQLQYQLYLVGVDVERNLGPVAIQGDNTLASANTHHGWIKEPRGLDSLIKTGHTDVDTGIACPAADSAVLSFNAEVGSTIGGGDGRNLVQAVTEHFWGLTERANHMNMAGTQFAIFMRPEQWRPTVDVWACNYATYRCSVANDGIFNDARDTNALRLQMMEGQYLLIDNMPIPVLFEEGIPRDGLGAFHFKSDMYIAPLSWRGLPLMYMQYFDMNNAYLQEFANFVRKDQVGVINNGLYLATQRDNGNCIEFLFSAKLRLILETPFLAGRIDDIGYTLRAPIRNSDPDDSFFYADGGLTYRG